MQNGGGKKEKIAIVAGSGELPILLTKSACEKGYETCGLAITDQAKHNIENICDRTYRVAPGQLKKTFKLIEKEEINKVVFVGKVSKLDLLRNVHKLDFTAIKYLSRLANLNDDTIHEGVISLAAEKNIEILPQKMFLSHLFQEKEILSERKPTLDERADIEYGFDIAKKIGTLDIGQTVVVKNKMILAVEAIEHTDEAIKRGCGFAKGEVVVVKVQRPNQDERFDVPTVGDRTIEAIAKGGGGILAFEAGKTLIADKEKTIAAANKHNICLVAV